MSAFSELADRAGSATVTRRSPAWPSGSRLVITALAVAVALGMLAPVAVVLSQALGTGWAVAWHLLVRPRTAELLGNTVSLVLITTTLAVVVGCAAAWLVERTSVPAPQLWRTLLLAPLAVPAFVSSYAWSSAVPWLHGLGGAVFITTLAYFPFVFLPVAALLRSLDQGQLDAARSLEVGPVAAAFRVSVPQLRPAVAGGALLVGLHLLAEYGVLEMMGFPTFTTSILQQFAVGFSTATGSLLALVLIALCLALLLLEVAVRGRGRISRIGSGSWRQPTRHRLGRWTTPVVAGLTVLVLLALAVPVLLVLRWLVVAVVSEAVAIRPLLAATGSTLGMATLAGLLTAIAALPTAWLRERHPSRLAAGLERTGYLASALPGVVIGLALVTLAVQWARPFYQTVGLAVVAYTILFLPRALVAWRSGLAAAPPELSEAARSLGQSGAATFARVVLPLVLPSALTGFVLVFLAAATELTATLLLAPTGVETLSTAFWAATGELNYAESAPYAAAMIALSGPFTLFLRQRLAEG